MDRRLRVAVAGASGIGKHHARWHHAAGSDVVGFLGSTPERCHATQQALSNQFPFAGKGYCDWQELLHELRPDLVDICLPNELHGQCALQALAAGCHVLCEKPLVWLPERTLDEILAQGQQLVDAACQADLKLGVCTQYAALLPHYMQLYRPARGELVRVESFHAEMETLARGRVRSGQDTWVDMGPHPLSLLLAWVPDGRIRPGSLQVEFGPSHARVAFDFVSAQGTCRADMTVRDVPEGKPARRFGVNGVLTDCEGRPDGQGVFRTVLRHGAHEVMGEDLMARLIAQFSEAARQPCVAPLASGETGLRNLQLQIEVMQPPAR